MTSIDPDGRLHPGRAGVYPETSSPISSARRLEIAISRPTAPLRIRGCDPFICICICSFGRGCILHACLQKLQRPCQQRLRPLRLQRQLQALQRPLHPRRPLQIHCRLQPLQRLSPRMQLLPLRLRPRLYKKCHGATAPWRALQRYMIMVGLRWARSAAEAAQNRCTNGG